MASPELAVVLGFLDPVARSGTIGRGTGPRATNTSIQRQIDATDRQIDRLVYELQDLTDDEINILEEATQ